MIHELNIFFVTSFTRENNDDINDPYIVFDITDEDKLRDIDITPEPVLLNI